MHALLVSAGKHNGVVEALRPAQGDVGLQRVHQPRRVDLNELLFREIGVAAGVGEELVGVVLNGVHAP